MIFLAAFKEMWTVRNMLSPCKLLHEGVIHFKDVPAFCLPLFTWLSTSSPGRPSFFIPKSGPTDFQCILCDVSLLLWATSKEEDEDSEEKTVWSANGSMLLPVSQSNELLSTTTHRSGAVRVLLPCSTWRSLLGTPAVPDLCNYLWHWAWAKGTWVWPTANQPAEPHDPSAAVTISVTAFYFYSACQRIYSDCSTLALLSETTECETSYIKKNAEVFIQND